MIRLFLLRHAKSSWAQVGQRDHDRPLNERGWAAAWAVGRHLADSGLRPDHVLCSTAERTRQTWERLATAFAEAPTIDFLDELYDDGPAAYVDAMREFGRSGGSLMLIGHNPSVEMAAFSLTRAADRDGNWHFPTAALAVIDFPVDDWADIEVGSGELWQFVRPRDLGVPGED
jgi:phosphohistidine phosphatase